MTWVTWRQYRLELIIGLLILVAMAAYLIPTAISKAALFQDSGLAACLSAGTGDCNRLNFELMDAYRRVNSIVTWFTLAPGIIGLLLATPLVMEFEQRTYRLAWTQSITRGRWLAIKLGFALLGAAVFALLFTPMTTWLYAPLDRVQDSFQTSFYLKGPMPFAYAVFALSLALASGAISRRSIVAVMVTLVGFFVAVLVIGNVLRPHYMAPIEQTLPIGAISGIYITSGSVSLEPAKTDGAWILSNNVIDQNGNVMTERDVSAMCGSLDKGTTACLTAHGLMTRLRYHPADRFWRFQATEAGIFLTMSALLLAATVWTVKARIR